MEYILAFFAGGILGICITCLLVASRDKDE